MTGRTRSRSRSRSRGPFSRWFSDNDELDPLEPIDAGSHSTDEDEDYDDDPDDDEVLEEHHLDHHLEHQRRHPFDTDSSATDSVTQFAEEGEPGARERANSIIGGEEVGENEQRIFKFSLPLSNPLPPANFTSLNLSKLKINLPKLMDSNELEGLLYDDLNVGSDEEHLTFSRVGTVNQRTHAIKAVIRSPLPKTSVLPAVNGPVIILGGYRGSVLKEAKTGNRAWVPYKAGFKMGRISLELGLKEEDERNAWKDIRPGKVLSHVGPIDISRRLIRTLRAQQGTTVYQFGYDWRLSGPHTSRRLYEYVKHVYEKEKKSVLIIAHSMGGIMAHHALQRFVKEQPEGQKYIRGIIYAGVPADCVSILGPLRRGDSVFFAKNILSPKTNFAMRSTFVFLPRNDRCFISKDMKTEWKVDFWDPETWIKHHLSPCVAKDPEVRHTQTNDPQTNEFTYEEAVEYLTRELKRAKKFNSELDPIPGAKYPPMCTLYGNTLPTCRGAKVKSEDHIKSDPYDDFWFGSGDGVVYRKSLMPIALGYKDVDAVATTYGHVGLLTDLVSVGEAISAIIRREGNVPEMAKTQTFDDALMTRSSTIINGAKDLGNISKRLLRIPGHKQVMSWSSSLSSAVRMNGSGPSTPTSSFLSDLDKADSDSISPTSSPLSRRAASASPRASRTNRFA